MKFTRGQKLTGLAIQHNKPANEVMIAMMLEGLADLGDSQFDLAITRAMRETKFFPSVAELRELAGVPKAEDRAEIAWAAMNRAMGQLSAYDSVCFSDPIVNAVVRSWGGWEAVKDLRAKDRRAWDTVQVAHFRKAYAAFCKVPPTHGQRAHLPGIAERQNGSIEDVKRAWPHLQAEALAGSIGALPQFVEVGLPAMPGLPRIDPPAPRERIPFQPPAEKPLTLPAPAPANAQSTLEDVRERLRLKTVSDSDDIEQRRKQLDDLGEA